MSCEKITLFIVLTLLVISGPAISQGKNSAEEIFRWFPGGYYSGASHTAWSELKKEELFEDFLLHVGGGAVDLVKPLPERFAEDLTCLTTATIYAIEPDSLLDSDSDDAGDKEDPSYDRDWSRIYVYRNADMARLLAEALEAGEFKDTGKRIAGNPVCTFGSDYLSLVRKTVSQYYVLLPTPDELLVAEESPELLRRMFRTGKGLEYGFIDEDNHKELFHLLPEQGNYWAVRFKNTVNLVRMHRAIKAGLDSEYLERLKSQFEDEPLYLITTFHMDERILFRETAYFESSGAARRVSEDEVFNPRTVSTSFPAATQNYQRQKIKKTRIRREGNLIFREVEYDEELLKLRVEGRKALKIWAEKVLPEYRKQLEQEEANKK